MTDLQATLDAIDCVTGCQHCGGPLGPSPSDDFCCEAHQTAWHAARATRLAPEVAADVPYLSPSAALAYMSGYADYDRPRRDEAAIERVQTGQWLARFAAPWHPPAMVVRAEHGRPPYMLNQIRYADPAPLWTAEAETVMFDATITQDTYRLESVDEHDRSAIYRIQGLPGPRHAVFRWADGQAPTWWMQSAWEGRWIEIPDGPQGHARGHRWNYPSGQTILASPTERYESREDGAVAEVWEAAPDREAMAYRRGMNRWRIMQEARISALIDTPSPYPYVRITGV